MFFVVSKLMNFIINPMTWIFFILLMALFSSKHQKKLVFVSLSMLFFFSNAFIFNEISRLWGLKKSMNTEIEYDVGIVLGGVADFDKKNNLLNFNNYSDRLFFAKKLFLNKKINKILFSGGNGELFSNDYVEAIEMKKFLIKNGINENDILIETRSRNTDENIKNSIEICNEKKFERMLLITSSMHMRRALLCCKKNNFDVDYFCTDRTKSYRVWKVKQILVPQNQFIKKWEELIHEMVGFIAYKILL
ncbi:MAG: hypothetical protein CMP71_06860 [Flavobacteriales bacterium]|nr:hypothetical protein [Flavobacteriales bacterium]|tara:strand:+ start:6029 stop:6772 length:744 start_codon:yes stop_codon:yes gene_type:complete